MIVPRRWFLKHILLFLGEICPPPPPPAEGAEGADPPHPPPAEGAEGHLYNIWRLFQNDVSWNIYYYSWERYVLRHPRRRRVRRVPSLRTLRRRGWWRMPTLRTLRLRRVRRDIFITSEDCSKTMVLETYTTILGRDMSSAASAGGGCGGSASSATPAGGTSL